MTGNKVARGPHGPNNSIHRPCLGEYKEVDEAYLIGKKLAESGKEHEAVYFLRSEYRKISDKWRDVVSESTEEYRS